MKSTELQFLSNHWANGDTVWASAFAFNKPKTALIAHQKPIQGKLSGSRYELLDGFGKNGVIRYFVPFGKDGKTLSWSKTVNVLSRDIADTEQEAIEQYNHRITQELQSLMATASICYEHIIPTKQNEDNKNGLYLSISFDALKDVILPETASAPDRDGDIMDWNEFEEYVDGGYLTDDDGFGELCIDGKVTENTTIYVHNRTLDIHGKCAMDFKNIPVVFKDHDVRVVWYNK